MAQTRHSPSLEQMSAAPARVPSQSQAPHPQTAAGVAALASRPSARDPSPFSRCAAIATVAAR